MQSSQRMEKPLPEGWQWVKLGEVCIQDRQIIDANSTEALKRPYLGLEHIESNTGRILFEEFEIIEQGKSTTFSFGNNHVLYGKLRPYLNKVALPSFEGRCTTELIPLLPINSINRDFLAWLLRREETVYAAMQAKTGSRMPRADMDELLNFLIPLPPLPEQQRIAARLREQMQAVDEARQAAEAQLQAAEELQGAYLREVFESNETKLWPKTSIGDFAETCSGSTPNRSIKDYYNNGEIPWIKTGELRDGYIEKTEENITSLALKECSLKILPLNTLLIAMYGQGQTRGRTGITKIEATTNQACFCILPNKNFINTEYLQLWFIHNYYKIRQETENRGGNQPNLNGIFLKKMIVPLPNVGKQNQIVIELKKRTEVLNKLKCSTKDQLTAINQLPATLLRQAFSGAL